MRNTQKLNPKQWIRTLTESTCEVAPVSGVYGYYHSSGTWDSETVNAPPNKMHFCLKNSYSFTLGGRRHDIRPGTFVWISGGVPWQISRPADVVYYYIRFLVSREAGDVRSTRDFMVLPNAWDLLPLVEQFVEEAGASSPYREQALKMTLGLIALKAERIQRRSYLSSGPVLRPEQRRRLERFVSEHVKDRLLPADLARETGLSPEYFRKIFKRTFGLSPRKWLVVQRIRMAATTLIQSSRTIQEIAYEYGYDNLYFFSRQFKEIMGTGPRMFRKNKKG